jgi:tRNA splicing endonuclease
LFVPVADPSSCHSFAMVVVKDYRSPFATVDIVSHCRVAKMVKKQLVVASQQNAQIMYLSLDHAVLAAAQPERR